MQKRGIVITGILVFLVGIILGYFYPFSSGEDTDYQSAFDYYNAELYDEAIIKFRENLENDPSDFDSWRGLGWSLYSKEIYDEALYAFIRASEINPEHFDPFNGIGWSNFFLKNHQDAIGAFEKAVELNPEHADSFYGLGETILANEFTDQYWTEAYGNWVKNSDRGLEALQESISLNPTTPHPYNALGYTHHWRARGDNDLEEYSLSEEAFSDALDLDPDHPKALSGLAWNTLWIDQLKPKSERRYPLIIDWFDKSIATAPSWDNYYGKALVKMHQGNYREAIADWEESLKLNPNYYGTYTLIGWSYYRLQTDFKEIGSFQPAMDNFLKALELSKTDYSALYGIGWVQNRQGLHTQALSNFEKSIQLNPDIAGSYSGKGFAYWGLGDSVNAEKYMAKALEIDPNEGTYNELMGFILLNQDRIEEAEKHFNLAFEKEGGDFHTYEGLGKVKLIQEEFDESIRFYQLSLDLNEHNYYAYSGLVTAQVRKGDLEGARESLLKVVNRFPGESNTHLWLAYVLYHLGDSDGAEGSISKALETSSAPGGNIFKTCIAEKNSQYTAENVAECIELYV